MAVWIRDDFRCFYCGIRMFDLYNQWLEGKIKRKQALLTVDHLVPRSQGGLWSLDNLVTCCYNCNQKKGSQIYVNERLKRKLEILDKLYKKNEPTKPIPRTSSFIVSIRLLLLSMWKKR